jgi:Protein of unknown function (DUF2459)
MKKLRRILGLLLAVAALTATLGMLVPRPLWRAAAASPAATRHILVLNNPIHTDIAIPVDDSVRQRFHFLVDAGIPADSREVRYIVFGWGGRAFYLETPTWSELKVVPVLKALTLDSSVMHVDVAGDITKDQTARFLSPVRPIPGWTAFTKPTATSTRWSAATPGQRRHCARPACAPAGGTHCRSRSACRCSFIIDG